EVSRCCGRTWARSPTTRAPTARRSWSGPTARCSPKSASRRSRTPACGGSRSASTRCVRRITTTSATAEARSPMCRRRSRGCAPHFMRLVHQTDPESPLLNYETRCPCGTQYCRITPDGKVTPCPYLPEVAGDLRWQRFADVWRSSPLFRRLREGPLQGKCGACEYRAVCGGCRARGFALEGDVLAADPSCLYQPTGDTAV